MHVLDQHTLGAGLEMQVSAFAQNAIQVMILLQPYKPHNDLI